MNRKLLSSLALATALVTPTLAFAQSSASTVSRASVRADLIRLERAGYNPALNQVDYPSNIQAAERRAEAASGQYSAGSSTSGSSESGLAR